MHAPLDALRDDHRGGHGGHRAAGRRCERAAWIPVFDFTIMIFFILELLLADASRRPRHTFDTPTRTASST